MPTRCQPKSERNNFRCRQSQDDLLQSKMVRLGRLKIAKIKHRIFCHEPRLAHYEASFLGDLSKACLIKKLIVATSKPQLRLNYYVK